MTDHIKEYWENQAETFKDSHWASWGDNFMIDLEISNIREYIDAECKVLDVGCANGYSTIQQLKATKLKSITGIDFSESMVAGANERKKTLSKDEQELVTFENGDVRKLPFGNESFDIAYTTRVIINLPTWEEQLNGINECLRVVKKGGKVIFCEGFWEPLMRLNAIRLLLGLEPLVEHDFNRYLKQERLKIWLDSKGYNYNFKDISSIYYMGSRVFRELVTDYESFEGYSNPINKQFYEIQKNYNGGGIGIQQLLVINK
ncbi:MAG: class I SAM-dependent methyltransferase [Deferribacterales bacterium]